MAICRIFISYNCIAYYSFYLFYWNLLSLFSLAQLYFDATKMYSFLISKTSLFISCFNHINLKKAAVNLVDISNIFIKQQKNKRKLSLSILRLFLVISSNISAMLNFLSMLIARALRESPVTPRVFGLFIYF